MGLLNVRKRRSFHGNDGPLRNVREMLRRTVDSASQVSSYVDRQERGVATRRRFVRAKESNIR